MCLTVLVGVGGFLNGPGKTNKYSPGGLTQVYKSTQLSPQGLNNQDLMRQQLLTHSPVCSNLRGASIQGLRAAGGQVRVLVQELRGVAGAGGQQRVHAGVGDQPPGEGQEGGRLH